MKNAQKVIFPQIATVTQGTLLTFFTDNLVCFKDYRAKNEKITLYYRRTFRNILIFFLLGGG